MKYNPIDTLNEMVIDAANQGIIQHNTMDQSLNGRTIRVNDEELINFGSCSYLGLEKHPLLIEGIIESVKKYGMNHLKA